LDLYRRHRAPFKDWDLPAALTQVRAKLKPHADGDRQFVKILGAVLDHGIFTNPAIQPIVEAPLKRTSRRRARCGRRRTQSCGRKWRFPVAR
jgi:hypothetical protein